MKREDRRPYIGGMDEIECSNYLRGLFKHDGLYHHVKEVLKTKSDKDNYFEDDEMMVGIEDKKLQRFIGIVEDKLRRELWEMAEELEKGKESVDKYIDGLLDAHGVPAYDPD